MYARFFMIVVALLLGVVSRSVATPAPYFLTDLGLSTNGGFSSVMDINNHGAIVGIGSQGTHIYSAGTYRRLEYQYGSIVVPQALNDFNQVVGFVRFPHRRDVAFLYSEGVVQELGTLGGIHSFATAINNRGEVAGYSLMPGDDFETHAFRYFEGTMTDLGFDGERSEAHGINNIGQIVGRAGGMQFIYQDGVMEHIGDFGRSLDINDSGTVVGWITFPGTQGVRAFVYQDGLTTDLGILGGPEFSSQATKINSRGEIIGSSGAFVGDNFDDIPFLYADGQMRDLNSLIDPTLGWTLDSVVSINDLGQIIGQGRNHSGQSRPYLLTPVPEPATLGLVSIGVIATWTRKRRRC